MAKVRLDTLLVQQGLVESRSLAQRLIMAGRVRVNDQIALKSSTKVDEHASINLDQGPRFVSRGGEKLQAALEAFAITTEGLVCADVGASTGGFTDCLLQHGATRIYAIDVGHGILHWKLRQDERVVVMERTNARYVSQLPEPVSLVTIDASFISLKLLLPIVRQWLAPGGAEMVALIKPQFEAGRAIVSKGSGVVRDANVHRQVLEGVLAYALDTGYSLHGLIRSPLLGPKGNTEFLAWLHAPPGTSKVPLELIDILIPPRLN